MKPGTALPDDVQRVIDVYLDDIEVVLQRASATRDERRSVCDEVEMQIREMLVEQVHRLPTAQDVRVLIAQMAPPHAFAEGEPLAADLGEDVWALPGGVYRGWLSATVAATTVLVVAGYSIFAAVTHSIRGEEFLLLNMAVLAAGGTLSTILAWRLLYDGARSGGPFVDSGLSVFAITLVPLFFAAATPFVLLEPVVENVLGIRSFRWPQFAATFSVSVALAAVIAFVAAAVVALLVDSALGGWGWDAIRTRMSRALNALTDRRQGVRARSRWITMARWICPLHLVGIGVAVIAVIVEVETIVFFGPVLSVSGLLLALGSARDSSWMGVLFGLSTPSISLVCLALIVGFSWSPSTAQVPIATLCGLYGLLATPLGVAAIYQLGWKDRRPAKPHPTTTLHPAC